MPPCSRPSPSPATCPMPPSKASAWNSCKAWGSMPRRPCCKRSPHPVFHHPRPPRFPHHQPGVPGQPFSAFLRPSPLKGHSLYEAGPAPSATNQWVAWPLEMPTSMGVHESQKPVSGMPGARTHRKPSPALATSHKPRPDRLGNRCSRPSTAPAWLNRWRPIELSYCLPSLRYDLELALLRAICPGGRSSSPPGKPADERSCWPRACR